MITSILGWIIFGLIVGALARFVVPGPDPMGLLATIGLGVAGSFVGGFLASLLFGGDAGLQPASFIGSFIGAILLIVALRRFGKSKVID